MASRKYLGLATTPHDPALAIVDPSGQIVFAEAAERYLQDKRAWFGCAAPPLWLAELIEAHTDPGDELIAAFSWDRAHIERLAEQPDFGAVGWSDILRASETALASIRLSGRELAEQRDFEHHSCHAAAACFTSPFPAAACAVIDGYGEGVTTGFFRYEDGALTRLEAAPDTLSLGMFYAKLTELCGWDWRKGEEWKVMGLASYGALDEDLYELLRASIRVEGLSLQAVPELPMFGPLLARYRRKPGQRASEVADLAHTGQQVFCDVTRELLTNLQAETGLDALALGGGCALNSAWNGQIIEQTPFARVHVCSAPGDDGNALGAAMLAHLADAGRVEPRTRVASPYLGSALSSRALDHLRRFSGLPIRELEEDQLGPSVAALLADGKLVGWAQGRAEYGPRALGNRSILADPRRAEVKDEINARVKFREEFRPFAPSVLDEHGPSYFEAYQSSPYMERTLRFHPGVRERVPGVVHVDGTGRLQSVRRDLNQRYYDLIAAFYELTGVPILLNTSFNIMGKPIVHTVEDALAVFLTTGLDALVLDTLLIEKPA